MEESTPARRRFERRTPVADVGRRKNVRALASFLGLDANEVAAGLVDAVERDRALKRFAATHRGT